MSTLTTFPHTMGDSWSRAGVAGIRAPDGTLLDLTGWQVRSQARDKDSGALVCEFACEIVDPLAQTYTQTALDTTTWPAGTLLSDVEFRSPSGFVVSTPVFAIAVAEDQTKPVA